jgi:hypothetical protein
VSEDGVEVVLWIGSTATTIGRVATPDEVPDLLHETARTMQEVTRAKVVLFKPHGRYYTVEEWRIPTTVPEGSYTREVIGPYDMLHSPDFRRIDGGAVLVTDSVWGYPHLFPNGA